MGLMCVSKAGNVGCCLTSHIDGTFFLWNSLEFVCVSKNQKYIT